MSDTGYFRSFYGAAASALSVGWMHSIHAAGEQKKQEILEEEGTTLGFTGSQSQLCKKLHLNQPFHSLPAARALQLTDTPSEGPEVVFFIICFLI